MCWQISMVAFLISVERSRASMPRKAYTTRMTHREVIRLFRSGKYIVDPELGKVYSSKGKELFSYPGSRDSTQLWVRLYNQPKHISIPVAHCVWLFVSGIPIPRHFQIHHRDINNLNDSYENLYCLFNKDHKKLHKLDVDLIEEPVPF